jgi:threonine dehydratase
LGAALELSTPDALWVKDETRHVSGSHKARHLMGLALWLAVSDLARTTTAQGPAGASATTPALAIASCGNAALAAAVVARAIERPLRVFIPTDAHPKVVERLRALGAVLEVCPRQPDVPGDPTLHAFRAAVQAGALPFCCQGNENGLTIEGGMTLGWEIASQLARTGALIDRLFVQVGGGALASSVAQDWTRPCAWACSPARRACTPCRPRAVIR